jgi:hypothetical protein
MAIVQQDSGSVFGNTLSATIQAAQIVQGPQIAPVKNPVYESEGLTVKWDDMTKAIVLQVSATPDFSNIVTTVPAVNGPVNIKLSAGTYWIRAYWQSDNITPVLYAGN